jgi:cytochrome c peroxidase
MTDSAKRGAALFNGERLECFHCHAGYNFSDATIDRGTSFSELDFHNTGLYNIDGLGAYPSPNTGRHEVTGKPEHMGQFRAQSLRNIELSAPYIHDGSVATLSEMIHNYANGGRLITSGENAGDGRISPVKDGFIVSFDITDDEVNDVVEFLKSLTDESFVTNPRFSDPWLEATQPEDSQTTATEL